MESIIKKNKIVITLLILAMIAFASSSSASAYELNFNSLGTQYLNITINYGQIESFDFKVSGQQYNGHYPTNISIDIGDDGINDWEYKVYDSKEKVDVRSILNAWSDEPRGESFGFVDMKAGSLANEGMFEFGTLNNNSFFDNGGNSLGYNGVLGIKVPGASTISLQILTIYLYNKTVHAFIPSASIDIASIGFYVTKGGSTYYCSNAHAFQFDPECDMTFEQSIVPVHLAREADEYGFSYIENVNNPQIVDSINEILRSCSYPCNITLKIRSESAGKLILNDFNYSGIEITHIPSEINIVENNSHYIVSINNHTSLNGAGYFFGKKPKVYLIPFEASDENRVLTIDQTRRIASLKNNISNSWDTLTNFSFPLDFKLSDGTYKVKDFNRGDDFSKFQNSILNNPPIQFEQDSILIMIDAWDYFPQVASYNHIGEGEDIGLIGNIYLNGLYDMPITSLEGYDEIMMNIALHEIAHTFIAYPDTNINGQELFKLGHPADFRGDELFFESSYSLDQSPTGNEGYFEIHSVMNPIRLYLLSAETENRLRLSDLDKMLMGLLSPSMLGSYTFYEGSIYESGNRFYANSLNPVLMYDARTIYDGRLNDYSWKIKGNSQTIDKGINTNFAISKQGQDNRSLWIIAKDNSNPDHFKVFNRYSVSSITPFSIHYPPIINIGSPKSSTTYSYTPILISLNSTAMLERCYFWDGAMIGFGTEMNINRTNNLSAYFYWQAGEGSHNLIIACWDIYGQNRIEYLNNIRVDSIPPTIQFEGPTGLDGQIVYSNNILVNVSAYDLVGGVQNISIYLYNSSFSLVGFVYSTISPLFYNFSVNSNGRYYFNSSATDGSNNIAFTDTRESVIATNQIISPTTPSGGGGGGGGGVKVTKINSSMNNSIKNYSNISNFTLPKIFSNINKTEEKTTEDPLTNDTINANTPITGSAINQNTDNKVNKMLVIISIVTLVVIVALVNLIRIHKRHKKSSYH